MPESVPAAIRRSGTVAPCAVLLVNGVVGARRSQAIGTTLAIAMTLEAAP
jgi:hypothetical protein